MVQGLSHFRDKTVLCVHASHILGQHITLRLAQLGATVVAIDPQSAALMRLARHFPNRIETLAIDVGNADTCKLLKSAWDHEPIHSLFDFSWLDGALQKGRLAELETQCALYDALAQGLVAGRAQMAVALPALSKTSPIRDIATRSAVASLIQQHSEQLDQCRVMGIELPFDLPTSDDALAEFSDALLMLCHPVSRALASGQVISMV